VAHTSDIHLGVLDPLRQRIASDLASLLCEGGGEIRFDQHNRMLYATDASMYQVEPLGVVCPRRVSDAAKVIEYCAAEGLAVLPRGAGTSLAGQSVNRAVIIDFSMHCRGILEIDPEQRYARVEPGVVLDQLNEAVAVHGLMFGPDVATSAQANIGGMIGNNSAGAFSIMYGRTVEHVLGVDVLLADGTPLQLFEGAAARDPRIGQLTQRIADVILPIERLIDERFPKIVRHVNGYNLDLILRQLRNSSAVWAGGASTFEKVNLAHLICGSEGTLAVVTQARLNLVPRPAHSGLAIMAFASVDDSLRALTAILSTQPAAIELIDDVVISLARQNREYCRYVQLLPEASTARAAALAAPGAVMYVAYFGDTVDALQAQFSNLQSHFPTRSLVCYTDPAAMQQAWKLRKAGEPLLHGLTSGGGRKPLTFIEDMAVDPHHLASFITELRHIVASHGTEAAFYAHASVGCLHVRPLVNPRDANDRRIMQSIMEQATDLVKRYGGALSGEHGDGRVRSPLLERFYGRDICNAFAAIKAIFDPEHRLNPGVIVNAPPQSILSHIRVQPVEGHTVRVPDVKTYFRFGRELSKAQGDIPNEMRPQREGFAEAIELCNGAGVCRKLRGGTMCPSYRATLDERHSPRGRGNALRLAVTGQIGQSRKPPPAWGDPATKETLDLCLSCKACKSECPSNVDIAKLKAEYLAQSYAHGDRVPLASRVFGNIRTVNQMGSSLPRIANALMNMPAAKWIARRVLGLHRNRELPRFEPSLYQWMFQRPLGGCASPGAPAVILFPDCFTTFGSPHIGRAAVLALEAMGFRVILPRLGCCGRAMISTGLLAQAIRTCRRTALRLHEILRRDQAVAIVGCEPSCVSAIKDDWLDLDMGIASALLDDLAGKTFLVEEFLDLHWENVKPKIAKAPMANVQRDEGQAAEVQIGEQARLSGLGLGQLDMGFSNTCVVLHAHCHQKALWGHESSSRILHRLLGNRLRVLDSGCCGMAGSFGYTSDHHEISMRIAEQSLFAQLREAPGALVLAPGTSCRQQIQDGLGRRALHPVELIASFVH
jgi:FAD/FMN-containing dehydrogenase/Fe-S oxidoreductase